MDQIRTNIKAIVNVSFKRNEGYYQYTFYVKGDDNCDYKTKCSSIIAVAKIMGAVSIYLYIYDNLHIIDPMCYDTTYNNQETMKIVYDSFTSGNANNIFL